MNNKGKQKYLEACQTLTNFCWQFRPFCYDCPFYSRSAYFCTLGDPKDFNIQTINEKLTKWEESK